MVASSSLAPMTARQLQASRILQATLNAVALGYFSPDNGIDGTGVLAQVAPEVTFNGSRVDKKSGKKLPDGIELRFQGYVPTEEVREKLKAAGFRFSEP